MESNEFIYVVFIVVILLSGFTFIGMGLFLGRRKIKEIDKIVHGAEIPDDSDSIFFKGFRLMNYGGAFAWRFGAKRSKLLYLRNHFDERFQRPFKIFFWLVVICCSLIIVIFVLDKLFLKITD
jgi:hypothetical protein